MRTRVELRSVAVVAVLAVAAFTGFFCVVLCGTAAAEQWYAAGARHQAMGGTGVATVRDSLASYWNPAAPALAPAGWDVQLPATLAGSIEQDALSSIGDLLELGAKAEDALDSILDGSLADKPEEVRDLIRLLAGLPTLGKDGQSFQSGIILGLIGRYTDGRHKNLTFGVLSNTAANVQPIFDSDLNLALSRLPGTLPADALARGLEILGTGPYTVPMDTALAVEIALAGPDAWGGGRAGQLVFLAESAGVDIADPRIRNILLNAAEATQSGLGPLTVNASGTFVRALSTQEFAVGYSHLVPMPFFKPLDGKVSLGANLKYILGVSYTRFVDYDDADSTGDLINLLLEKDNIVTSHNFGIDLGLMVAPFDWLTLGLTARNINSPDFDAAIGQDASLPRAVREKEKNLTLDAQVRAGIALMPFKSLVLAMDVDLTENSGINLPGFRSRLVSFGAEYRPFASAKNFDLALRGGAYNNIADGFNDNWAITLGLGFRLWNFVLDASGGVSTERENFNSSSQGKKIPNRLLAGVTLKYEKRF